MKVSLVGYTGFVGSNIYLSGACDAVYHSQNIEDAYGTNPDLLIYAGLRAEKYLANHEPEKDMGSVYQAEENITKINPKKLVLISTIDVFKAPQNVDEKSKIHTVHLCPYGFNRYQLEVWVRKKFSDALIIRLPGLFGKNIKKNFIYDYIHVIPGVLNENKFQELIRIDPDLKDYYEFYCNGFYKVNVCAEKKDTLKDKFRNLGFSALNFTDSRSIYQFYDLSRLWGDIQTALHMEIPLWHAATEPISIRELYQYLSGGDFLNEIQEIPAHYNCKTRYAEAFGGRNGYICNKSEVLRTIKKFIDGSLNGD